MDTYRKILIDRISSASVIIFVSPHLDDAILSSGELIIGLSLKVPIKVVTVFTEATSLPYSDFAAEYTKLCGYKNALSLFRTRRQEDIEAFKHVGIKPIHLGFVDAAWRRSTTQPILIKFLSKFDRSLLYAYPHGVFPRRFNILDNITICKIKRAINKLVPKKQPYLIFCPLANGSHVDHILVRDLCTRLFKHNVVYWSDYPYSRNSLANENFILSNNLHKVIFDDSHKKGVRKILLIKKYESQMKSLFAERKILIDPEEYYFSH